jgi:hypothetical protein
MPFKRGYFEQLSARSEQLEKFDELARKALEQRRLRYEEWKTWRSDVSFSNSVMRLKSKVRSSPAPGDGTMAAVYNLAGQSMSRFINSF